MNILAKNRWSWIVFLALLLPQYAESQIHGQIMEELNTRDYDSIVTAVEDYLQAHPKEEKARLQFERWKYRNCTRLTADGKIHNYQADAYFKRKAYDEAHAFQKAFSEPHGNWVAQGPFTALSIQPGLSIPPNELGRVNCIAQDPGNPQIMYLGSASGGIWKSTDYGGNWSPTGDGIPTLAVQDIVIDPSSPIGNRTIYVQTGDKDGQDAPTYGLLKSTDGGSTWFRVFEEESYIPNGVQIDPNNSNTLLTSFGSKLYKSTNAGGSWIEIYAGVVDDFTYKPGSSNTIYIVNLFGLVYSNDGGSTWTTVNWSSVPGSASNFSDVHVAVTPANPNVIYVFGLNGSNGHTLKSTNSGVSLTHQSVKSSLTTYGGYCFTGTVSSNNENVVYMGDIGIYKSSNSGASYSSISSGIHPDQHFLGFMKPHVSGYPDFLWSGHDGGASLRFEIGIFNTWITRTRGASITQLYGMDVNKRLDRNTPAPVFGSQDNGSHLLVSGEGRRLLSGDGIECFYGRQTGTHEVYLTIQNGNIKRYKLNSPPLTMEHLSPPSATGWVVGSGAPFHTFIGQHEYNNAGYTDPDILFALQKDVWINSSPSHLASHWHKISNLNESGSRQRAAGSPLEKCNMAASFGGKLYVSTNGPGCSLGGSQSWALRTPPGVYGSVTDIVFSATNANTFWVTFGKLGTGRVWKTTDLGVTWQDITGSLPNITVNTIETDEKWNNGLYVGTDAGIFYRNDDLGTWIPFDNGMPSVIVEELDYDPIADRIYAGTYGRGIWRSEEYSRNCVNHYNFTSPQNGTEVYAAYDYIYSASQIAPMSDVRYTARNTIILKDGFHVKATDITPTGFHAHLSDICANGSLAKAITGIYVDGRTTFDENKEVVVQKSDDPYLVFPNPTKRLLNIKSTDGSDFEVQAFNGLNQQILNRESALGKSVIDLHAIESGVIFLRIINENGETYTHKVIKL